jgi:hypothetical protein
MRCTPMRYTSHEAHTHEVHAHEGFYEDLARQNTVARLFQRQLGSVWSHMGFSHRRGVLKASI